MTIYLKKNKKNLHNQSIYECIILNRVVPLLDIEYNFTFLLILGIPQNLSPIKSSDNTS